MATWIDQTGRRVELEREPKRIVSLVPSQTELLVDLGVEVIGRTKFCIHPTEKVASIPIIGGTKEINYERIDALRPDLIIGNKEENTRQIVEQLSPHFPIYLTDVRTLDDALTMISDVGALVGRQANANAIRSEIEAGFASLEPCPLPLRAAYFIWRKPWMVVGGDTFIDDMLMRAGFENVFAHHQDSRYPAVTIEEIAEARLEVLLFSSEPYPFDQARFRRELEEQLPDVKSIVVDGELFSWYGSRLRLTADYLAGLLS